MPIEVEIPGKGIAEFPDGMAEDDILRTIKRSELLDRQEQLGAESAPGLFRTFVEESAEPFVAIPKPEAEPDDPKALAFAKGLSQVAIGAAETVESPLGVSALAASAIPGAGKFIGRGLAAGFGVQSTLEGFKEAARAYQEGDAEGAGRAVGSLLLGGAMVRGAAAVPKPKPVTAIETVTEGKAKPPPLPTTTVSKPSGSEPPSRQLAASEALPLKPVVAAPEGSVLVESAAPRIEGPLPPAPPESPPLPVPAGTAPEAVVVRPPADYNIFNNLNSRQFTFQFGQLGEAAKSAWEDMALAEFRMREAIERDAQSLVESTVAALPKNVKADGAKAFFQTLDGRTMEQITADWTRRSGGDVVIAQAAKVKDRLESIRTTIRDTKREGFEQYLGGLNKASLAELYRTNVEPTADFGRLMNDPAVTKATLARGIAEAEYPADWGIADGSYLPHIFSGSWAASVVQGESTRFVLRAKTPQEAKIRLAEFVAANPEMRGATFRIEQDMAIPADVVRLGDRQFFTLLGKMREKLEISGEEARDATLGILGRKASKQKWWGNLQRRMGAANYEQDFTKAMRTYLSGFHRWRVLSELQREVQPKIEVVRREGRSNAARELDTLMDYLWGKPAQTTLEFDALLARTPWLRDHVKPLALDRWLRNVRSAGATLFLTTPRFAVVNRLQPLQGLYPLLNERTLVRAKVLQHTAEGRALLDRHGVTRDVGQFGEVGVRGRLERAREKLTGERSNQELAFLSMYLHGIERGLPEPAAVSYAKLRGQLFTQFTPLVVDTPAFMRGPVTATVFQFTRFPIKQIELISRMVADRNLSGIGRMTASWALLGGASLTLYQGFRDKERLALKRHLNEALGEDTANLVMYGLPGFLGIDLSGSLALIDEPYGDNIYTALGRRLTGPAGSAAIDLIRTLFTPERAATGPLDDALILAKRLPALKPIAEGIDFLRGNVDVLSPDGEVAYRRTLTEMLLNMGSFRTANQANVRTAVDGIIEIQKERAGLENELFVAALRGDDSIDKAIERIQGFNDRWPEAALTGKDLQGYLKRRAQAMNKTDQERIVGRLRLLLPEDTQ